MEAISLKLDEALLEEMDQNLSKYRYSTRTEFIRDAIRSKLSELEKKELMEAVHHLRGSSKRRTTGKELHDIREQLAEKYFVGLK